MVMPNSLDREAFEAWWGEAPTELVPLQKRTPEEALSAWVWLAWQAGAAAERARVAELVAGDAYAITFQTMGQYRGALLRNIRGLT